MSPFTCQRIKLSNSPGLSAKSCKPKKIHGSEVPSLIFSLLRSTSKYKTRFRGSIQILHPITLQQISFTVFHRNQTTIPSLQLHFSTKVRNLLTPSYTTTIDYYLLPQLPNRTPSSISNEPSINQEAEPF